MFQVTFGAGDNTRFNPSETQNALIDPLFYAAKCCRLNSLMSSCIYAATYFILLTFVHVFYAFSVFFGIIFLTFILTLCCSSSLSFSCCMTTHDIAALFLIRDAHICWGSLKRPGIWFLINTHPQNKGLITAMCLKENYFLQCNNNKGQQKGEEPLPVPIITDN